MSINKKEIAEAQEYMREQIITPDSFHDKLPKGWETLDTPEGKRIVGTWNTDPNGHKIFLENDRVPRYIRGSAKFFKEHFPGVVNNELPDSEMILVQVNIEGPSH